MVPRAAAFFLLISFLSTWASPSTAVATEPIVATLTIPATSVSYSTFSSVVTSTSTHYNISTYTTTVGNTPTTVTTNLGPDRVDVTSFTSTGVSTIVVSIQTVVTSTIGYSTILSVDSTSTSLSASPSGIYSILLSTSTVLVTAAASVSDQSVTQGVNLVKSSSVPVAPASAMSTANPESFQHKSSGISGGEKAGIGIGAALGVLLLLVVSYYLGQLRSRRRSPVAAKDTNFDPEDDFLAKPYGAQAKTQAEAFMDGIHRPEDMTRPGYEMPNRRLSGHGQLSVVPAVEKVVDEPMYVGVPTHMSGSQRWSRSTCATLENE